MSSLSLYDRDTGEVSGRLYASNPARAARSKQARTISAFVDWAFSQGLLVAFWTLGTNWLYSSDGAVGRISECMRVLVQGQSCGRKKYHPGLEPLPGLYVAVIEAGETGGYLHAHYIVASSPGERWEVDGYGGIRWRWRFLTGLEKPHVDVRLVTNADGAAQYVRKLGSYLRKSACEERAPYFAGRRCLRSSKGLMQRFAVPSADSGCSIMLYVPDSDSAK